jgi:hypothetical protein
MLQSRRWFRQIHSETRIGPDVEQRMNQTPMPVLASIVPNDLEFRIVEFLSRSSLRLLNFGLQETVPTTYRPSLHRVCLSSVVLSELPTWYPYPGYRE